MTTENMVFDFEQIIQNYSYGNVPKEISESFRNSETLGARTFIIFKTYNEMPTQPGNHGNHSSGAMRPYSIEYITSFVKENILGDTLKPGSTVTADCRTTTWLFYGQYCFLIYVTVSG